MQIIDNQKVKMVDVLNNIIPTSKTLYFRTGYFYFSGFEEIYRNLKNVNVKILVGKDCQKGLGDLVQELDYTDLSVRSPRSVRNEYYHSLIDVFGKVGDIDNRRTEEALEVFKEKIRNGSLEIRKTVIPDHSKVYVFENDNTYSQNGLSLGSVIIGSSNLTRSGIVSQFETNHLHRDNQEFTHYLNQFNQLWETSIPLVERDSFEEFNQQVLDKVWVTSTPSPYCVFIRVLDEYFSMEENHDIITPSKITDERIDLKYQIDAIRDALNIIEKHNGVIIADVVGLGKSIIASCIARNLDLDTIVIAPPHLTQQWEDYRFEFRFNAKVYGSGSVEKALSEISSEKKKLIIVDEAHKFRNEEKSLYANLHKLTKGNKVVILTATPFNNDPRDLFSLIKLFQSPGKSTLQTIDNLTLRFKGLISEYNKIKKLKKDKKAEDEVKQRIDKLSQEMKDLIGPLLIRRSRLDLDRDKEYREDLEIQGIKFPKVQPPIALKYDFGSLQELYIDTLQTLVPEGTEDGFQGVRYNIVDNINDKKKKEEIAKSLNIDINLLLKSQANIAEFMKRLLVHRFESSVEAFRKTLDNMIYSYEKIEAWYQKGKVPIYKKGDLPDIEDFYDAEGDEVLDEVDELYDYYEEKGLVWVESSYLKDSFKNLLKKDLEILRQIRLMWEDFNPKEDPKLHKVEQKLKEVLKINPKRKIVIFSIYSDTVEYLYDQLKDEFRIFKYSSKDSSASNKTIIKENFDAGSSIQKDEYDILIATDAISEGYNLHRAGIIFNYDIPYNPTRVIQRVGRINRVNKKVYDQLFIYNFFPSPTGEAETGIKRIATLKIDFIKALLGDDTHYLTEDEIIKTYNEKVEEEFKSSDEESWNVRYRNILYSLQKSEELDKAKEIPKRVKIRRSNTTKQQGVLVFGKKNGDYAFKLAVQGAKEPISLITMEALQLFEASPEEPPQKVTLDFYKLYEQAKENLFVKRTEVPNDRGVREALAKILWIKENYPKYDEYFTELEYVMKTLGDLPAKHAKTVRKITKDNLEKDIENLMTDVPIDYLVRIREEAEKVGEGPESLILAEELI